MVKIPDITLEPNVTSEQLEKFNRLLDRANAATEDIDSLKGRGNVETAVYNYLHGYMGVIAERIKAIKKRMTKTSVYNSENNKMIREKEEMVNEVVRMVEELEGEDFH